MRDGAAPAAQEATHEYHDEADAELEAKMRCVCVGPEGSVRLGWPSALTYQTPPRSHCFPI